MSPGPISVRALCLLGIAGVCGVASCEPTVVVGQWNCVEPDASTASDADWLPWWTGFESQTCDYLRVGGFCYADGGGSHHTVTAPVHSGNYAEAFSVTAQGIRNQSQVRCVRQGTLPGAAYYGAWYYLPSNATSSGLWNLFHFQGASTPNGIAHGLWDVSLVTGANGKLHARVLNFLYTGAAGGNAVEASIPVPIGSWFHFEFFLKRAKDRTGEVDLYQDGVRVARFTKVVTDDTNWGQWFVGNLVDTLNPPESTVYVDDVTIAATLGWTPPQ
ncbi:MAG: heparin lyase I family protein [Pseudomonadota bacterium]